MSDLESLEKRIEKLESKIEKLENEVGDIKVVSGRTEEKFNNIEKIVAKLNDETIPGLIQKIDNLNAKIDSLNLKNHFDIWDFVKNKLIPTILIGGITYFIAKK